MRRKFTETVRRFIYDLELGEGREAILEVQKANTQQDPPSMSDEVRAVVRLSLPTGEYSKRELPNELQFVSRCKVFETMLSSGWGDLDDAGERDPLQKNRRYKTSVIKAPTWKEAFDNAQAYGTQQVEKLLAVLEERRQALVNADYYDDEEAA